MLQTIRHLTVLAGVFALLAIPAAAQNDTGSKTRAGDPNGTRGNELGLKPDSVLDIIKLKSAYVMDVDLQKRTVTVSAKREEKGIELAFPQPNGLEQIKLSKKAQKRLGVQKIRLEQLKVGTQVRVQYYPVLEQFLELLVQQPRT